jgi:hypothetical protein
MIAAEANKKASQAEADRARKKGPYKSDPSCICGGASSAHRTILQEFFVRYFDAKIAALINYRDARANYAMLNQIPDRLRDHAKRVAAEFEIERQKLAAFEQERLIAAGGGPLQKKAADAKATLDSTEAEAAQANQRLEALDQRYDAIAGQDNSGAFTKVIELMAGERFSRRCAHSLP